MHLPALRAWFARRSSANDVEDLVQEAMMRMYARSSDTPIENLQGYLFRVAAAVLADNGRRRTVRHAAAHVELTEIHYPREDRDPARVLEGKESVARLIAGLEMLGERTRSAFVLHRFEEMPYAEIATTLGVSISAVEKHIMKALKHLAGLGLP